jgi:diguanylate cyclase (GGDEF)-like protein/PAS domain S-box-containing protein
MKIYNPLIGIVTRSLLLLAIITFLSTTISLIILLTIQSPFLVPVVIVLTVAAIGIFSLRPVLDRLRDYSTEMKRESQELRNVQEQTRLMFEHSPVGIVISGLDNQVMQVNQAFLDALGYSEQELIGINLTEITHPEDNEPNIEFLKKLIKGEINYFQMEKRYIRKNGELIYAILQVSLLRDLNDSPILLIGQIMNITERKKAEMLAMDRNEVLEMVVRNKPLPAILTHLIFMVERQRQGLYCAVMLIRDGKVYFTVAPSLFTHYPQVLESIMSEPLGQTGMHIDNSSINSTMELGFPNIRDSEFGTRWCAPIYSSSGHVLGFFAVYLEGSEALQSHDLELLEMSARVASIAIEQRQLTDQLAYQAHHDTLTALPNRLLFEDRLRHAITTATRNSANVALLFLDLDRFKLVNDTLGHHVGDLLLKEVAKRLTNCIRKNDTLARMGGDEFTLVLTDIDDPHDAMRAAQRFIEVFEHPFYVMGTELHISTSIGICLYPADGKTGEELLRKADTAMYRAKEAGKNNYQFYSDELNSYSRERLDMENQLRGALARNEMLVYYHPLYELSSRAVVGFEALLRWNHPKMGIIPPSKFIPIAEESGLIIPLGRWVLQQACSQSRHWQNEGYGIYKVSVNVSALQFERSDFVEVVSEVLKDYNLNPQHLVLEITETLLMHRTRDAGQKLNQLRNLGVGIAIDDFGTGYSSLSYLQHLPIDTLKIDRSFVSEIRIGDKPGSQDGAIVKAITTLAHSLGMKVAAEGVESEAQLELLEHIGCDMLQGYLFSKPLPVDEVEKFLLLQPKALPVA